MRRLALCSAALVLLLAPSAPALSAQETAPAAAAAGEAASREAFAYFTGTWSCAGAFANGRPIEADMAFAPMLEGKWMQQRHTDRAPSTFQAVAMWGRDAGAAGRFVSVIHDNFGGVRRFASDGWADGRVVFESDLPASTAQRERFTYQRQSDTAFRMEWLVSRDAGRNWQLGDYLVCTKG